MQTRTLTPAEATSAVAIQLAIDSLPPEGGRLVLPALDLTLDRGLELRTGVTLEGQGAATILRKGPGRDYPLSGYHNYGMCDVPLLETEGLAVGMTVSIRDNVRRGFYETFARITWIDGNWVGFDHGIEADYASDCQPRLATGYPLLFGHGVRRVAIRNLTLDGRSVDQHGDLGGCRGGAVYFAKSCDVEFDRITEYDYLGEGLSFQMCRDVTIRDCDFSRNTGNGLHPGAGSTNVRFERCTANGNGAAGFFFCVRATRITVADCTFADNALGVSIGTRDCHNLLTRCTVRDNAGAGILLREYPAPTEVYDIAITDCTLTGNGHADGAAQIEAEPDAHDVSIVGNTLTAPVGRATPGIRIARGLGRYHLAGNRFAGCSVDVDAAPEALLAAAPAGLVAGYEADLDEQHFRHLPVVF